MVISLYFTILPSFSISKSESESLQEDSNKPIEDICTSHKNSVSYLLLFLYSFIPLFLYSFITAFNIAYWHKKYHSGTICKGVSNPHASNALSGCEKEENPKCICRRYR